MSFLEKTALRPEKIVFIDDREENLKNVESALLRFDSSIEFEGIHYLGAKDYPSLSITEQEFEARWEEIATIAKEID